MSTTKQKMTCPKCGAEVLSGQVCCQNCGEVPDKDAGKYVSAPDRRGLPWFIAFILCLVYAIPFTFILLVFWDWAVAVAGLKIVLIFGVVPLVIAFVSIAVARKWELISGVVLIVEYLFLIIWDLIAKQYFMDTRFFLPVPVAGILFILSWFLYRRKRRKHLEAEIN